MATTAPTSIVCPTQVDTTTTCWASDLLSCFGLQQGEQEVARPTNRAMRRRPALLQAAVEQTTCQDLLSAVARGQGLQLRKLETHIWHAKRMQMQTRSSSSHKSHHCHHKLQAHANADEAKVLSKLPPCQRGHASKVAKAG